jgi:hypothetical protein
MTTPLFSSISRWRKPFPICRPPRVPTDSCSVPIKEKSSRAQNSGRQGPPRQRWTCWQVFRLDSPWGVAVDPGQRDKLEKIARYIARPALSEERLSVNSRGQVIYKLKTPYDDGTTQIVFEPLEFLEKLAALVPRPRVHLTRFHGVLAPNHKHRKLIIPTPPSTTPTQEKADQSQDDENKNASTKKSASPGLNCSSESSK